MSTKAGGRDHLFLFTYGNRFLITCGFCFNIHYLFVYLFKAMSTKAGGSDHLFLFTYGNWLLITCVFRFNINYLFLYLFKAMSTKAGGSDHLFLFTYGNHFLWDMVFVWIFSIYLFIYSKWCQQKQLELMTFIYLWKSLLVTNGFRFNIQYLFIYLFKAMSTKAGGTDDLYYMCLRGVLVFLFRVQIHGALIAFLIVLQWNFENLLGEKQPKFTETSKPLILSTISAATETCTVGKRAARILLECFLVYLSKLVVVIYLSFIFRNPSLESYYILN